MNRILSTKKLPKLVKEKLAAAEIKLVEKNFIQTKSIAFETPILNDYLVFTSKEAVKSVLRAEIKSVLSIPCLCVGIKTRKFLEKKGFTVLENTDYADDLIRLIDLKYKKSSFTFFCGTIRKNTIPNYFLQNEIAYNEIIVYETKLKPQQIEKDFQSVLFYSPSGVESFLKNNTLENKTCFCIGTTTAKTVELNLNVLELKNIIIANQPTVENVITEVLNYYKRL